MNKELIHKNLLALDVDQTLAKGVVKAHLLTYNDWLQLSMTPDQINEADLHHAKTFDVPQIKEYRERGRVEESLFQEVRNAIRTSPEVHLNCSPLPFATEAVRFLTADKTIAFKGYYTIRPKEVRNATQKWLKKNNFPQPNRTIICDTHEDKLKKIILDSLFYGHKSQLNNTKVVVIDDSFKQLIEAASNLVDKSKTWKSLVKSVVIVGFGINQANKHKLLEGVIYPDLGLQTLSLPSWEQSNVEQLISTLKS